ncbi:MAG: glycoside hydrolase family 95 protein [Candidatus Aminicenantes bacterium]|nr:glycoside hydrolase family 95 protein [Candidatus Aminicenantes bacterium]
MHRPDIFRCVMSVAVFFVLGGWCEAGDDALAARFPAARHDLRSGSLAPSWDEGLPLGNGLIGALIWKKGDALRFSLDRADLWDLRPVKEFERPEFRFSWVREQVLKRDYKPVHELGDIPYDRDPAPTKIPAAALEFDIAALGEVASVRLDLRAALAEVEWKNGARMSTFVHAGETVGWFVFEGLPEAVEPRLIPPPYVRADDRKESRDVVTGKTLASLGYPPPVILEAQNSVYYHQEGWGGMSYEVAVEWQRPRPGLLVGLWTVSSAYPRLETGFLAVVNAQKAWKRTLTSDLETHLALWQDYWEKSLIEIPDPLLEAQWYREVYKFGSASRRGAPPITLQAVWTADNGSLPPWKGDFHHDLNTQLSYWPCYSGNRLDKGLAFLDWLWAVRPEAEKYTKTFFGTAGLNFPGVSTLEGKPMGGWIQYSLGPTVSAWLAHHFYLHWAFSRDRLFLGDRAYPWLRSVAVFLDQLSERGPGGKRKLPLSSSPEINDNRVEAWFNETTNYDLALIRWLYGATAELAGELGLKNEQQKWKKALSEWPELALAEDDGRLLVAPGYPLRESHRHFSHLMAIHPLGLLSMDGGEADRRTIRASLAELDRLGPDWWCGYSYSWLGNMAAWAGDGEKAAKALRTFAACFCLPNSFHVNGDQCRAGHSKFTYRPFTLEGNFAFASAIQEMLLQSQTGVVRIFPAVPATWKNVAFERLRARGAFLVSARRRNGRFVEASVTSEKGGDLSLEIPSDGGACRVSGIPEDRMRKRDRNVVVDMAPGETLVVRADGPLSPSK